MTKKLLLVIPLLVSILFGNTVRAQIVDLVEIGTSGNAAFGTGTYSANENIYTETEIGAANFTTAATAINIIGINVNTPAAAPTFTNINIWMKEVPLTTTTFSSGTYTTTGYTLVFSGSVHAADTGFTDIALTTPFVRNTGNNLQVLIERTDNIAHTGYVYKCSRGNSTLGVSALTTRRYNGTVALSASTSLTASAFRNAVRFAHIIDDVKVTNLYTLGKLPLTYGDNHVIQAKVINEGTGTLTNLNVTLGITGANVFNDVQVIPSLAPGAFQIVSFLPFTATTLGTNTVTVSVPTDDISTNNAKTITQEVTQNLTTYKEGTAPSPGGIGFTGATGDFVAKFNTSAVAQINEIKVDFFSGGQPYQIGIWDASGTAGAPGTNLWTSTSFTSVSGTAFIPVPNIGVIGDYFVGVKQTGTTNVSFGFQNEYSIRPNTFYYTSPTGGTSWTDFSIPNNYFRFSIEPQYYIPQPPNCATAFVPADNASNVDPVTTTQLSWASGGGGATDYDVYFGTTYPPPFVGNQTTTTLPVTLATGTTYYLHVLAKNLSGNATGCDTIEFTTLAPPANDDCANATLLTSDASTSCTTPTSGTLIGATASTGPAAACGTFDDDVWYSFVATNTTHSINLTYVSGSTADFAFQVLDACGTVANELLCSDPETATLTGLTVNNTYYIRVASWDAIAGQTSNFTICVATPPPPPPNDTICGATVLIIDSPFPSCTNTVGATTGSDDPATNPCSTNNNTVWYQFTPTVSQALYIEVTVPTTSTDPLSAWLTTYTATGTCPGVLALTNAGGIGTTCQSNPYPATAGSYTLFQTAPLVANTTYYLFVDGNSGDVGDICMRVIVNPLAIKLENISATNTGASNRIDWNTLSEEITDKFELQRSADGKEFETIASFNAKGQANRYSYPDNSPHKGINYYRLLMKEANGTISYSQTVTATVKSDGFVVSAYPNPVSDELTVTVDGLLDVNASIAITDITGKIVRTTKMTDRKEIINMTGLANGLYFVKYSDGVNTQTLRVTKQ